MRIVISFTTLPSRFLQILPMVESIVRQTKKVDRCILWLPPRCDKENSEYHVNEGAIRHLSNAGVEVAFCERDYGPATKLIPTLKSETDGDTLIITFDDDVYYESHIVENFEKAALKYPGYVLGLVGALGSQFVHAEELPRLNVETLRVDGLGGYRGIAYRRSFFDNSIFEDIEAMLVDGPFVVDDQLFSWNLARRGITGMVIGTEPSRIPNTINSAMLDLGNGIYLGAGEKSKELACKSLERLKALYDRNGWRRPQ